jgi:hypothetical protein
MEIEGTAVYRDADGNELDENPFYGLVRKLIHLGFSDTHDGTDVNKANLASALNLTKAERASLDEVEL